MNRINIIINGFGRIGRSVFRQLINQIDYNCDFIINDPYVSIDNAIYLIKYDSIYGRFGFEVIKNTDNQFTINKSGEIFNVIYFSNENIQDILPCSQYYLIDTSGKKYTVSEYASMLKKGCKHVLVSRWLEDVSNTFLWGYSNPTVLDTHKIISCGICDAVGLAPIINLLLPMEIDGINIVTMHPWLSYQNVLDGQPRDVTHINFPNYQIGRASNASIIPKETSVLKIFKKLFTTIQDDLFIMTYRVPTEVVTCCDMNIRFKKAISRDAILQTISDSKLYEICNDPMVSRDFIFSTLLGSIDVNWLKVDNNNLHLTIWYNNEIGYANSIVKTLQYLITKESWHEQCNDKC